MAFINNETVWLTQKQIATLFGKAKSTVNEYIKNIYEENELEESSTMKKFGISEFQQILITTLNLLLLKNFMLQFKINYIVA